MRRARLSGSRVPTTSRPSRRAVSTAVASLVRDGWVLLQAVDAEDLYAQVWLRPDGLYQLEHRAGGPDRHFRALTVSQEKVERVLLAWFAEDDGWDVGIDWTDVSAMFRDDG